MNSFIICANIIKRAFKSGKELVLMLVLPIAAIGMITFINGSPVLQAANMGVVNQDNGAYSKKLVSYMEGQKYVKTVFMDGDKYKDDVKKGTVSFAVVIPDGFSKAVEAGEKTNIELWGGNMKSEAERLKSDVNRYIMELFMISYSASDIGQKSGRDKSEVLDVLSKKVDNAALSTNFHLAGNGDNEERVRNLLASIGFSIMFLMVFVFNTIGTIIEDRKKLTLARIFTYPVRERDIIAGNLLGSLSLGTIQLVPVIAFITVIYKLTSITTILGLFLILFCFMICTIGLGIGISGLIKNDYNPTLIIASVIFPTCLIGGCLIPESMLPEFIAPISYAVPQKWVLSAINQLMTGGGFQNVLLDLGIVLMFGLAFATFGVRMLRPMND